MEKVLIERKFKFTKFRFVYIVITKNLLHYEYIECLNIRELILCLENLGATNDNILDLLKRSWF